MYAIVTKYMGPTNGRGSRVKATAGGRPSVSTPYEHEGNEAEHLRARNAWIAKHCGPDHVFNTCADRLRWAVGTLPNGDTVHVPYLVPHDQLQPLTDALTKLKKSISEG